jgi:probable DNA metabolism protein
MFNRPSSRTAKRRDDPELYQAALTSETDFTGWRHAARHAFLAGIEPARLVFTVGEAADLLAQAKPPATDTKITVPATFASLAETVILARDPQRFSLLYRLLWRLKRELPNLMEDAADKDVARALALQKSIGRDIHKMRAFLRFREVPDGAGVRHVAWFEPSHYIIAANAPFFIRRFAQSRWSILSPDASVHWDVETLRIAPGASRADLPPDDAMAEAWRVYFESIFNPARLKPTMMRSEMPMKYWRNLPEAASIATLRREAGPRTTAMLRNQNKIRFQAEKP